MVLTPKQQEFITAVDRGDEVNGQIITVGKNHYFKAYLPKRSDLLFITFNQHGEEVPTADAETGHQDPWGYAYLRKYYPCSVLSVSFIGQPDWYRSKDLHAFFEILGPLLKQRYPDIRGYGGSMGGFAVSAFSNVLGIRKMLLLNPFSALLPSIVPFDRRYRDDLVNFNWDMGYADGAESNASGFIVYDPLYRTDRKHADRFRLLSHLRVPGVGHGIPAHLNRMRMLRWTFDEFYHDRLNPSEFSKRARIRRDYHGYYAGIYASRTLRLTQKRKEILGKYAYIARIRRNPGGALTHILTDAEVEDLKETAAMISQRHPRQAMLLAKLAHKSRRHDEEAAAAYRKYSGWLEGGYTGTWPEMQKRRLRKLWRIISRSSPPEGTAASPSTDEDSK